jgi:hypothetical protein
MTAETLVDIVDETMAAVQAGLSFAPSTMTFPDESAAWPSARLADRAGV